MQTLPAPGSLRYVTLDRKVHAKLDTVKSLLARVERVAAGHITTSIALADLGPILASLQTEMSGLAEALSSQNPAHLKEAA